MSNPLHDPLVRRAYSKQELTDYAEAWAKANLAELKKRDAELYYARLGMLIHFATDLYDNPNHPPF